MTTVYQYIIYCIQEATFVYTWGTDAPTSCPNNHADKTIDPAQTVIVGKTGTSIVLASQDVLQNFQHTCVPLTVPSMTPGTIYTQNFSWPMDIQIWKTEFYTTSAHLGDYLTVFVAPETVVGVLTQAATAGDTVLHVSPTAVTNGIISRGVNLEINGLLVGSGEEDCGRIIAFSTTDNTITVENPTVNSYNVGSKVELSFKVINNILLHRQNSVYRIGEKGLKGKLIPANTVMQAQYTNNDGAAKELVIVVEIYYQ